MKIFLLWNFETRVLKSHYLPFLSGLKMIISEKQVLVKIFKLLQKRKI